VCLFGLSCEEAEVFSGMWNGKWQKEQNCAGSFHCFGEKCAGLLFFSVFLFI